MTIDPDRATPVYLQLAAILEERIRSGELPAGRIIPSENTLIGEFGIARETVRKAVNVLRERELVVTVHGRGTFVAEDLDT